MQLRKLLRLMRYLRSVRPAHTRTRWSGTALSMMAFLAMTGCAPGRGAQVASDGEASNVEEALIPGVLSPSPCTKVKMVAPTQFFIATVGVPVLLTAVAKCPPG